MNTFTATVNISLKKSVLDPQGKTIEQALQASGFQEAKDLRVGKIITMSVNSANKAEAEEKVNEMCAKLLVNPVIEDFSVTNVEQTGTSS